MIDKIKEFLEINYSAKIVENKRKELYALDIDFKLLAEFDLDLADNLLGNFEETSNMFQFALEQMAEEENEHLIKPRFFNLSQSCNRDIWKLRKDNVSKLVTIKGYIRKIGDVQLAIQKAVFKCPCQELIPITMHDGIYKTPKQCLPKGTLIRTPDGLKPIEKANQVLCLDYDGKLITHKSKIIKTGEQQLWKINGEIECSENHMWYVVRLGKCRYLPTKNLYSRDILLMINEINMYDLPKRIRARSKDKEKERSRQIQSDIFGKKNLLIGMPKETMETLPEKTLQNGCRHSKDTGYVYQSTDGRERYSHDIIGQQKSNINKIKRQQYSSQVIPPASNNRYTTGEENLSCGGSESKLQAWREMWRRILQKNSKGEPNRGMSFLRNKGKANSSSQGFKSSKPFCRQSNSYVQFMPYEISRITKTSKIVEMFDLQVLDYNNFMININNKNILSHNCGCGRKDKFQLISKEFIDFQKLVLEEDSMVIKPPQKPRSILCLLEEDLCRTEIDKTLQASRKITISGVVKEKKIKPDSAECISYIEANSIQVVDEGISTIKITDEDIKKFKEMESPTIYEDLAQSIIPNIEGQDAAKLGILYQLMGGVPLYKDGQLEERDLIHILLVSGPGQGKSKILERAALFIPGSVITGGKGISGCGLIATVSKDEELGGWVLEPGAIPRASGALVGIDECDKISKADIAYMNSAMTLKKVRIDKATIHQELECDTIILAAANPTNRVFERNKLIWEQIGLPKDFLDRFDLIFIIQSGDKEEEKKKVADLVVGKYRDESKEANPIYTHDLVVKFIAYARQNCKPKMTKEVQEYIVQNFLNIVKPVGKEEDTGYFSYRLLTNIIRLSQAVAKVRLVKEVINGNPNQDIIEEDAKRAINLLIESLKQQDIITMDNLFDYERAEAITPKKKRDAMRIIKQIIKDLQETPGIPEKLADYEDIKKLAIEASIDSDTLDEMIELLKRPGEILEIRRDKFQLQ
jgi:replicative DNA helicase Mcm